uniref:biosynthetic-type acetolactate synthase large subunit n=1 Tax=Eubacterium cellulosolvens TaxID=29322 RepID=UPI000482808C|nr:biosynthetic-type acetolactate synthase large subunit [[Eubacterium] cellulosolvens]
MNGAEAMVKCLEAEGITQIFGIPGVAIAPFYEAMYNSKNLQHILVRQEQAAGHAASGYARISKKPAVCVTSSGPGATNLITALATAYADSIPMVAITGQVNSNLLGRDVFQEADMRGATESFVKYSYLVKNADDLPRVFKEAFYIASTGRQGPVLIDIPCDVQMAHLKKEFKYPEEVNIRGYKPSTKGNGQQMAKVIAAINKAKKPLICAGGGVILGDGEKVVTDFCEKFNIPLVTTMMGIGVMPKKHPLYFGMLGNNGKPYANRAVANSDLLIVAGARIADRAVPKPENLEKQVNVIHIDIDSAEIGKNLGPTIPLVGDIKNIFNSLLEADIRIDTENWIRDLEEIKTSTVDHRVFSDRLVNPMILVQTLSEKMDDDAVYVADVGQNQLWSADNYVMKSGRFMTTGGMGTMGYSIPAAIGVKVCQPERQVVAVCGDGDFQMSMFELGTMAVNRIPLKILVMRNQYLGLVREHQEKTYEGHYSGVQLDKYPHYDHLAAAYDMDYFHAQENEELDAELERFLKCENAAIMVCEIDSINKVK